MNLVNDKDPYPALFPQWSQYVHFVPGNSPLIQKASAEEFIHTFVNNSGKLTQFLEHMVKVSGTRHTVKPLI